MVTGAASGIGQAMAVGLAEAGCNMVLVVHSQSPDETVKRIEAAGRECLVLKCDLGGPIEALQQLSLAAEDKFGRLDILVNNAGIIRRNDAMTYTEKDWDDVMNVNSKSVFFLSQAAAQSMAKRGSGKIVSIASMLTFQGGIRVPSYAASKGAVGQVTKALANEWAGLGINVNAIAPGYIATDNTAPIRQDAGREQAIRERIPAGRWGTPDDLVGAVLFLCSDAANYVHGHILCVDGGWLAR